MSFKVDLYIAILLSIDSLEFLPVNQYIFLKRVPNYFLLVQIYFLQVILWSRCMPRYLASSAWGISCPFKSTSEHDSFLRMKMICTDLFSLAFICHFLYHFSMQLKFFWRLCKTMIRLLCTEKMTEIVRKRGSYCYVAVR